MWNFMPFGGWLAWRLDGAHEVFMDGRNALAREPSLVVRAARSEEDQATFDGLVAELDMQWAVARAAEGEVFALPLAREERWAMAFLDDAAAVYVRRDGPNAPLAAEGYRVLRHLSTRERVLRMAVALATEAGPRADDLAHDGALAAAQAPDSARAAFFEACGAVATRDRAVFDRARARLARLSPGTASLTALEDAWSMP
jgi:hypothetical protein